jgi:DNA repair exonuclease SbcCD ATPase subunit
VSNVNTQAKQAKEQLQAALDAYNLHLGQWTPETLQSELTRLEAEVAQYQSHNDTYMAWSAAKTQFEAYVHFEGYEVAAYEVAVATQQGELAKVRAKRDVNQSLKASVEAYELIVVAQVKVVDSLQVNGQCTQQDEEVARLSGLKGTLEAELKVVQKIINDLSAIKDKEDEILKLERQEAIHSSLVYTFGPKGLLVERLETICDYMNDRTNAALSKIMRDNVLLKFYMDGDSIDLDIILNGKTRGVANLSGGEQNKVGLACLLGLRSLIPDTHQTNLLIVDEIDASWDDYVRAEMVDLYQEMLRSTTLDTILCVTHSTPTRELPVWQSTWNVTKRNGVSTLEVL